MIYGIGYETKCIVKHLGIMSGMRTFTDLVCTETERDVGNLVGDGDTGWATFCLFHFLYMFDASPASLPLCWAVTKVRARRYVNLFLIPYVASLDVMEEVCARVHCLVKHWAGQ